MMTFEIVDTGRLVPVAVEKILDPSQRGSSHYWVDLTAPSSEELERWLEILNPPEIAKSFARGTLTIGGEIASSGAVVLDTATLFTLPIYGGGEKVPAPFSAICIEGLLVSFHPGALPVLHQATLAAQQGDVLPVPSISGLVCALCRFFARLSGDTGSQLRAKLLEISTRMDKSSGEVSLTEILEIDEELQVLDATVHRQIAPLRSLESANTRPLNLVDLAASYSFATSNLSFLDQTIDRLERRVDVLRGRYDSKLAERTNRRLAVLTMLSAIFMPLTLIAGIYGMNFQHMPELDNTYSYPAVWVVMAAVTAGMLWYFRQHGWFD